MPIWAWILMAIVALAAIAAVAWMAWSRRRTDALRGQFGPEYDRAVSDRGTRRDAESELLARRSRREQLDIRPLSPERRQRYLRDWTNVQSRFVDAPSDAIGEADRMVVLVMQERGYPMENFEQRSSDISVDHPEVVENYRAAHAISLANDNARASTEDLRQGMVHYRALFEELLGGGSEIREEAP